MQIQWQTNTTLTLKGKEYRVVINPVESTGSKPIISLRENDLLISTTNIQIPDTKGYHINGAGEYSYQGVTVRTKVIKQSDDSDKVNLISLSVENILLAVVCGITKELNPAELEFIGSPDILIISLNESFGSEKIVHLISAVEPRIVVPVYTTDAHLQALNSEYGVKQESQNELTMKKAELPFDSIEIKPLIPQIKS